MARSKDPEGTLNLILDVFERLCIEKGYENTTIQDVIKELGGLSKGAIYHHFKSKGDIFRAVADRRNQAVYEQFDEIANDTSRTGAEKLKMIVALSAGQSASDPIIQAAPKILNDPHLLASAIRNTFEDIIPNYIYPLILEGVEDGSIQTDSPKQLAEIITISVDIWLNPVIYSENPQEAESRARLFNQMISQFGFTLVDDDVIADYVKFCDSVAIARQQKQANK